MQYPDLGSDPFHKLATRYLPGGSCGIEVTDGLIADVDQALATV